MLHFNLLTLFAGMFPGPLGHSLSKKALDNGAWSYTTVDIRDFAEDTHRTVDDTPCGGGAGMVMKPDVISDALESLDPVGRFIYLSPRGRLLDQPLVRELAEEDTVTLLCGRYEGVDQRVLDAWEAEEVSVGDYVLSGGEPAALVLMDACIRLLPGVMGNVDTAGEESFENGLLEYPHYTRPASWTGPDGAVHDVPDVLLSGHHGKIAEWRRESSENLTRERRPDLWEKYAQDGKKRK